MFRLNRKLEYALMALKVMACKRPGELTTAKEVVEKTGCPFDATARVLQRLAHAEILRSEHGAHGGYLLIRDLNRLTFRELTELILGRLALAKCLEAHPDCDLINSCNIVHPVQILNRKLVAFYDSVTVGELMTVRERPQVDMEMRGTL